MPSLSSLWAVSPMDGRYRNVCEQLSELVSEGALIKYRLQVEISWLIHLLGCAPGGENVFDVQLSDNQRRWLLGMTEGLDHRACERVKDIEAVTNHDVKACEYYLREVLTEQGFPNDALALIHFCCTSEDINNAAYALMHRRTRDVVLLPMMAELVDHLLAIAKQDAATPMLSRTHGQAASPTTVGKEFAVFANRLLRLREEVAQQPIRAKMNGAVGNYNAHRIAQGDLDWPAFCRSFVEGHLQCEWNPLTTQIEDHDALVAFCSTLARFNHVGIDLARDLWGYISLGYFGLKRVAAEVGSSTMPHKINPIDFENAEGNFGLSSALAEFMSRKLPVSRWQRDLSDSTVLRSYGSMVAYHMIAQKSLIRGLGKLECRTEELAKDVDPSWEVLTEAVQTVMRRHGIVDSYEQLKQLSRGHSVDQVTLHAFIRQSEIPDVDKERLLMLTPATYVGDATRLVKEFLQDASSRNG